MFIGCFEIQERNLEGFRLLAPVDFWDASEEQIDENTGGCGPGNIGDWFVPDTMYGEPVLLACRIHDWMYWQGKCLEDKKAADRTFLWNMTVLIQEMPETGQTEGQFLDQFRLRRVMTYYQAVYYGGSGSFETGDTPKKEEITRGWDDYNTK